MSRITCLARHAARLAEQAFNAALAEAQAEMQPVRADCENDQTRSRYASHASLDKAIRPIYTKHGLAITFDSEDATRPDDIRVVAYVCHDEGHTRRYRLDMPCDGKGAKGGDVMTRTHAVGSGVTYGKRYLLGMIFNIAVSKDDDGNAASGRAKPERPRTVVPAPKHALKQGGIAERAMVARAAQAREPKPPKIFRASQAGHLDEPPPHDFIPDGPGEAGAKALNRRLHPMNDELPAHSAPPRNDGIPPFLDRRRSAEPSYLDLVGGADA